MSYYADWDYTTHHPNVLRRNTRIYWGQQCHTQPSGRCVGTFIGENPGAAHAARRKTGWDSLVENNSTRSGDKTLRFLREAWENAVKLTGKSPPDEEEYLEVLNTYYFRCPASGQQLANWRSSGGRTIYFQAINQDSKFVLLGWGKSINNSKECDDLLATLSGQPVITSDARGIVGALPSPVHFPLASYPAQPSAIAQRGNNPVFLTNLANQLASFI